MVVTRDQLWLEFKKAIDAGNWTRFKTRRGMDGYLKRKLKRFPGRRLDFVFMPEPGTYKFVTLEVTDKDLKDALGHVPKDLPGVRKRR